MQHDDNSQKNLLLAVVLSVMVLLGWQLFFVNPKIQDEQARRKTEQAAQTQTAPGAPAQPGQAAPPAGVPGAPPMQTPQVALTRPQALAAAPRVAIKTPSVEGSINLRGGRIDDLALVRYHERPDPSSPHVVLLSPSSAPEPYYTELGWLAAQGTTLQLPDASTEWQVESGSTLTPETPVTLRWTNDAGQVFRRKVSIDASYMFQIDDSIENTGTAPVAVNHYSTIARQGTPKLEGFWILHEGLVGVTNDKLQEITYAKILENAQGGPSKNPPIEKLKGSWFGITDKYWATALIPDPSQTADLILNAYPKTSTGREAYQVSYWTGGVNIAPGSSQAVSTRLFAGAKDVNTIEVYEQSLNINKFDLMIDWGMFYFITKPMFHVIDWLAGFFGRLGFVGNFGLAILATTVLVKAAFFYLANKSYASMAKMKKMQPEVERIRERYKDDRARIQQEMMDLYKKEKINPMAGCLPIVVQIPVFFALYKVLFVTLDMRHAPFYGWVRDLSAADPTTIFNLFGLLPFDPTTVPVLGQFLHLGAWPIIMGMTMWVQMQLNPQQPDPLQQKLFNWMPVLFTFMLAAFPVGLVIYWAWNNILSLMQQYLINRKHGAENHLWKNLGLEKLQRKISARSEKSGP
jgi:YidC/Oxa1 family membrane protein insertase